MQIEVLPQGYADAMALGSAIYAQAGNRVAKSLDAGITWTRFNKVFPDDVVSCFPTKDGILLTSIVGHVYKSADDGQNWVEVLALTDANSYITTRAWAQSTTGTIFGGTYGEANGNLYIWKSVDDGDNWTRIDYFADKDVRHIHIVFVDVETNRLYVSTGDTNKVTYYSDDEGVNWTQIIASDGEHGFTSFTSNSTTRYLADDNLTNGIYKTVDDINLTKIYSTGITDIVMPGGIAAVDGTSKLWATFDDQNNKPSFHSSIVYSTDDGNTWRIIKSNSGIEGYRYRMPCYDWRHRIPVELGCFICTCVSSRQMIKISQPTGPRLIRGKWTSAQVHRTIRKHH